MKLTDKIFIQEAIEILKLQNKPRDYVIHSLMNDKKISTYFDVNVVATESTGYAMQPINQDGDELPYVNGVPPIQIEGPDKKILEADVRGENIEVLRFEHEGKFYCGADNEGTELKPIIFESKYIYFNKSEFSAYQDLPAYQDKSHEHYAPELDLAIQLHKAIVIEKYGNQDHNRERRITNWLSKNYDQYEFKDAAITRLSTVIGDKKLKKK